MKMRKTFAIAAAAVASSSTLMGSQASGATQESPTPDGTREWKDAPFGTLGSTALDACVDEAKRQRPETWTCLGGTLTTTVVEDGKEVINSLEVVPYENHVTRPGEETFSSASAAFLSGKKRASGNEFSAAAGGSFDDIWCETYPTCTTWDGNYNSKVKGNAAYGNLNGFIGEFDYVVHQLFNGNRPQWKTSVIWDYGPEINFNDFYTRCRRHIDGAPDANCGTNVVLLPSISAGNVVEQWLGPNSFDGNPELLGTPNWKYHDDSWGSFRAYGYGNTWTAGTLHTGRWFNCGSSTACEYYQRPWTNNP
jgi:hypothetical protein